MPFSNKFVPRKRKYIEYMLVRLAKKNKEKRTNERANERVSERKPTLYMSTSNKQINQIIKIEKQQQQQQNATITTEQQRR